MVKELEVHKKDKFPDVKWNASSYYDHPDGEDLMGKLSFVLKNAAFVSVLTGVLYANKPPQTDTVGKLFRIARFVLPGIAMGFTFTSVTYLCTNIRKKDDGLNHGLGGVAAGLLLGPASGIPGLSTAGALLFGFVACLNKNFNMKGYDFKGKSYKKHYGSYYKRVLDFSKLPEIKGNWTRDP